MTTRGRDLPDSWNLFVGSTTLLTSINGSSGDRMGGLPFGDK